MISLEDWNYRAAIIYNLKVKYITIAALMLYSILTKHVVVGLQRDNYSH